MKDFSKSTFLTTVAGDNFSGRSTYLKMLSNQKEGFLYIGELPSNFITGIFPTVKSEIDLHSGSTPIEILNTVRSLISKYDFEKHFNKNPFTLSGGEQAILVILSMLLLNPEKLSIDTTLEQLNEEWRIPLLDAIQQGQFYQSKVFLSDNRLKEYNLVNSQLIVPVNSKSAHKYRFEKPFFNHQLKAQSIYHNIELTDLSFAYYKNEIILDKVNIHLEPKSIYHLNGRNGAGKSTLAKLLTGILKLKNGKLFVEGKEFSAYKYPGQLVGYSFQNPDEQIFSSTVEEEVLISLKNETVDYSERREIYLEMFGLQFVRKCHPAELPFVIRKRISLAATLATERPWYILDEPTLGQDDSFVEFLVSLLHNLAEGGKGIIIISHSKSLVGKLNVKSLTLSSGKLTH